MNDERWYTVEELAQRWRVNAETVRRWVRSGQIVALVLGQKAGFRFAASEVRRFEEARMSRWKHDDES